MQFIVAVRIATIEPMVLNFMAITVEITVIMPDTAEITKIMKTTAVVAR